MQLLANSQAVVNHAGNQRPFVSHAGLPLNQGSQGYNLLNRQALLIRQLLPLRRPVFIKLSQLQLHQILRAPGYQHIVGFREQKALQLVKILADRDVIIRNIQLRTAAQKLVRGAQAGLLPNISNLRHRFALRDGHIDRVGFTTPALQLRQHLSIAYLAAENICARPQICLRLFPAHIEHKGRHVFNHSVFRQPAGHCHAAHPLVDNHRHRLSQMSRAGQQISRRAANHRQQQHQPNQQGRRFFQFSFCQNCHSPLIYAALY